MDAEQRNSIVEQSDILALAIVYSQFSVIRVSSKGGREGAGEASPPDNSASPQNYTHNAILIPHIVLHTHIYMAACMISSPPSPPVNFPSKHMQFIGLNYYNNMPSHPKGVNRKSTIMEL